jgi:type IV secretory pathway component VirB8
LKVYKTGVTHYFNIDKARRELGYQPTVQNDLTSVVRWYVERGRHRNRQQNKSQLLSFIISVFIAVAFAFVLLSWLPTVQ